MTAPAVALRGPAGDPARTAGVVTVTSPPPRAAWTEVIAADRRALASQSPEWLDALCACGRYENATRMYETPTGTRVVLPLARRRGLPRALATQASLPHAWGMGGVVADGPIREPEMAAIARDVASLPALRTSIRPNPLHDARWAAAAGPLGAIVVPRRAHVLDLDGGVEVVWQRRFGSAARGKVRKAERAGLELECGSGDSQLEAFHRLLERSVERWARAQNEPPALARLRARRRDPLEKFKAIAAAIGDSLRVWVARRDGLPVAAVVVLVGADAHYTRGAMERDLAAPTAANELLHWHAIRDACESGCRYYHMGESGSSKTLARFKEKLGARPLAYAEYRFERAPLTRSEAAARGLVKRALRFRDA